MPGAAFLIPSAIWLLRTYMMRIPAELNEAAYMDGASQFYTFRRVILPIARPGIIVVAIVTFIGAYSQQFIFALTFVESESVKTVTIGVMSFAVALRADWGVLMAGLALSILPILATFLVMQRQFVGGLTSGAVK